MAYLHDTIYPNNSVIDLEDIGEGGAGLHCYTEVATCCRSTDNPNGHSSGQWLFPNGEVVGSRTSSRPDVFSRTRDRRSVILHRGPEATGPTGIFTCEVPDRSGATQKLYFGIYNKLEGKKLTLRFTIAIVLSEKFYLEFLVQSTTSATYLLYNDSVLMKFFRYERKHQVMSLYRQN